MPEKCDEIVKKIGQYTYIMRRAARNIEDMVKFLYGFSWRFIFGERISVPQAVARLYRDLETGSLELKDTQICMRDRCVDLKRLFHYLDVYYDAYGERLRLLREAEWCEE